MGDPRFGFERFDCAPGLRLEAHERVAKLQFDSLNRRLDKIELLIERLEKRLWLAVYGVVAVVVAQALQSLLTVTP
ncbi:MULTISPECIES: GTA head formation protein, RCAP_rcc01685 family [unclassified Shimia]|uniref:GTA head formation protein, RCAP_rcc01685 family n=1 Tax=unclassified Shimia TaxID=2630038 RepID=UPI00310BB599